MRNQYCFLLLSLYFFVAGCDSEVPRKSGSDTGAGAPAIGTGNQPDGELGSQEVEVQEGCDINAPLPGRSYDRVQSFSAWGYAFDPVSGEVSEGVKLRIESEDSSESLVVDAKRGRREDVSKAFNREELVMSGFGADMDVSVLPPGRYSISVIQQVKRGVIVCKSPAPFTLR